MGVFDALIPFATEFGTPSPSVARRMCSGGTSSLGGATGQPPGRQAPNLAIEDTDGGHAAEISLLLPSAGAGPRGTGRNWQGRPGTAGAVDRPFVHVTGDDRDLAGRGRDPGGDGGATCKIAGIAYTGSNPVPAT